MIFCVEDDRNIRELLVYTLSTTGYQELKNNRPELILLDIMLPGRTVMRFWTSSKPTAPRKRFRSSW